MDNQNMKRKMTVRINGRQEIRHTISTPKQEYSPSTSCCDKAKANAAVAKIAEHLDVKSFIFNV